MSKTSEPSESVLEYVQVTVLVNALLKITPLGTPLVPLPVMVKLPPLAKTAVVARLPESIDPVMKVTVPRSPWTGPLPPRPVTSESVDPVRVRPEELPARVPRLLAKSTLSANAASGKARNNKDSRSVRFTIRSSLLHARKPVKSFGSFRPPVGGPNLASETLRAQLAGRGGLQREHTAGGTLALNGRKVNAVYSVYSDGGGSL